MTNEKITAIVKRLEAVYDELAAQQRENVKRIETLKRDNETLERLKRTVAELAVLVAK